MRSSAGQGPRLTIRVRSRSVRNVGLGVDEPCSADLSVDLPVTIDDRARDEGLPHPRCLG